MITGASSGIGEALAREHHRRGDRTVLLARRTDRLDAIARELGAPLRSLSLACDVHRREDLDAAVARAVEVFGGVDVVYANAGFGVDGRFEDLTLDDFRRQFETNVFGVLQTAWATLDALTKRRGVFAVMGSVAGHLPTPGAVAYNMSKYAVRAFAETMRHEWAPRGVSVVHIAPGFIDSEIRRVDRAGVYHDEYRDPAPRWLIMPAHRAARQMADAVAARRRELVVTGHGKFGVMMSRLSPGVVQGVFRLAASRVRRKGAP